MKHKNIRKVGYSPTALTVLSFAGSALGAVTSVMGQQQQKKSLKKAEEAETRRVALQNRLNDIEAQKQRVRAQREARIKTAQITTSTTGGNVGLFGTSSFVGGVGSVSTSEAKNISNINTNLGFSQALGTATSDYNTAVGEASGWKDVSNLGMNIFTQSGGFESLFKPFSSNLFSSNSSNAGGSLFSTAPSAGGLKLG